VTGKLIGIAKVAQLLAPLDEMQSANASVDAGIASDIRGRKRNRQIKIGEVTPGIALETEPCQLMERAHAGLNAALTPSWRGGVSCNVIFGGAIRLRDAVLLDLGNFLKRR